MTADCPKCGADKFAIELRDMGLTWAYYMLTREEQLRRLREKPAGCLKCGWGGTAAEANLRFSATEIDED